MSSQEREAREVARFTADVEGWLTENEGLYLYSLARLASRQGCIVEIGSWKGKSTIWLAKGSQAAQGAEVYAIDPHTPDGVSEKQFRENIKKAGVEATVQPMVMGSVEAVRGWDKPIGLLWIDGDHKYRGVRGDFFWWYPYVVEGGMIALHDTLNRKGVKRFVQRQVLRLAAQGRLRVLDQVDEILAVQKLKSLSGLDLSTRRLLLWMEWPRRCHGPARYATNMGKHYLRLGDYLTARQYFRLAFSYQPLYWRNLRRWALAYMRVFLPLYRPRKSRSRKSVADERMKRSFR